MIKTFFRYNEFSLAVPEAFSRSISTTLWTAVIIPRLPKLHRFPYIFALNDQILSVPPLEEISETLLSHPETRRMKLAFLAPTTNFHLLGQDSRQHLKCIGHQSVADFNQLPFHINFCLFVFGFLVLFQSWTCTVLSPPLVHADAVIWNGWSPEYWYCDS